LENEDLKKIELKRLDEVLYFKKLKNGLKVYVLPKKFFFKTYAFFVTRYGSIDNCFELDGLKFEVPDGIAHFLEHKMFEQPSGIDVFQEFSSQGASSNAFTSFTKTAYLFSCTRNVEKNISTLLDFVQTPYFTAENVEKEKGIIAQEIKMYNDNPDFRCYFGLIAAMYHKHPVRVDIAGTVDSIQKITKDLLYTCYNAFYHPSNMLLFIVGSFDAFKIFELIEKNQESKKFEKKKLIKRFFVEEPVGVFQEKNEIKMNVKIPKFLCGFKEKSVGKKGRELIKQTLATSIFLEAFIGQGTPLYQSLYDEGLIDSSFSFDYTLEASFGFSMLGSDTKKPLLLLEKILEKIQDFLKVKVKKDDFERLKRKKIGGYLRSFNSLEWIANHFSSYNFLDANLFEVLEILEALTLDDVNNYLENHIDLKQFAYSVVSKE